MIDDEMQLSNGEMTLLLIIEQKLMRDWKKLQIFINDFLHLIIKKELNMIKFLQAKLISISSKDMTQSMKVRFDCHFLLSSRLRIRI